MSLGRIMRFVIVAGCLIGAYTNIVSASVIHEQNCLIRLDQEPKSSADNAEFQVKKWEKAYFELKRKEAISSRLSTVQLTRLQKEIKETKKEYLYWINRRSEELIKNRDEAKTKGNTADAKRYNDELKRLSREAETINADK